MQETETAEQISYAKTVYGESEIAAVVQCLRESTQMGKYTSAFEEEIADLFAKKKALYVNSGTSALHIGIESFDFPAGSEIITPALTFGTTVSGILKNNLIPAFVDVEPLTYCIDASQIEALISNKTVAILAPDLLGNICDWPQIRSIANKYNLKVLQDSADTLGATFNGNDVGEYSDMSITSFYGSHIINCAGNGGALCLNDDAYIEKAKLLRSWGRSSSLFDSDSESIENRFNIQLGSIDYDAKFIFSMPGYNLEGSEIGAAFGLVQLQSLRENIAERKRNFEIQENFFSDFPTYFMNPVVKPGVETAFLAYPVMISNEAPFSRRDLQIYLEQKNIQTRVCFTGNILKQPMMKGVESKTLQAGYPNADAIMERGILLPVHHGMTSKMFDRLHQTVRAFISEFG
jgi:CDP-4-dehydro-6-deoxyglucose reductase, E1